MTILNVITAMLTGHLAPGAVPPKVLAPAIIEAARAHNVDPKLIARIVIIESRGKADAYNAKTGDYGLMQLNKATILAYGISETCVKNWRCNLIKGTKVLADMLSMKGARSCVYNLGPKGRFKKYETACVRYETKLASID